MNRNPGIRGLQEAKGFKGDIGKSKLQNKLRKQDAKTAKEKRRKKLDSLQSNPSSWKNLESYDPRTPSTYFKSQRRGKEPQVLDRFNRTVDELLNDLYAIKEVTSSTLATKKIVDMEIDRAKLLKHKQISKKKADKIVNVIIHGTDDDVEDAIKEALDYKAFSKSEQLMIDKGQEIEEQIFWDPLYDHK